MPSVSHISSSLIQTCLPHWPDSRAADWSSLNLRHISVTRQTTAVFNICPPQESFLYPVRFTKAGLSVPLLSSPSPFHFSIVDIPSGLVTCHQKWDCWESVPMELSGRFHESNNPFGYSWSFQFTEINLCSQMVETTFQLLFLSLDITQFLS